MTNLENQERYHNYFNIDLFYCDVVVTLNALEITVELSKVTFELVVKKVSYPIA